MSILPHLVRRGVANARTGPTSTEKTMRKIIASTFLSLDGVMQAPGGPERRTRGAASSSAAGPRPTGTMRSER